MSIRLTAAWQNAPAARCFANLWPMYVHEITAYATDFYALDDDGVWQPDLIGDWTTPVTPPANLRVAVADTDPRQPLQRAYVIARDGQLAGFACVGLAPFRFMPDDADVILCELFLVRRARGGGVGEAALTELFARHPGRWFLRAIRDNARAIGFWRRVLPRAPVRGLEERREDGDIVWRFIAGDGTTDHTDPRDLWYARLMRTTAEKAEAFRALHARAEAFVIPNPWDVGTARLLARLGFEALATTSAGFAFAAGQRDNSIGRERMLRHVETIVAATDLPVSADLENGFGDAPEDAAETIRLGAATGLAGGSIEDATGRAGEPIYAFDLAVERVRAAAEAARAAPHPFTLTARAENFLVGRRDLADTIRRLQAYQEAGADVLYAPGLTTRDDIAAVVSSVDRPVNVLAGLAGMDLDVAALSGLGVKRVSVGSALARVAFGAFLRAAEAMRTRGTFELGDAVGYADLSGMFDP